MDLNPFLSPLKLSLLKQGHRDVAPAHNELQCSGSEAGSSPCSSIKSYTVVRNYGNDMNRDFDIITKLEEKVGRELDHVELQESIDAFEQQHGREPTVDELALVLSGQDCSPGSPEGAGCSNTAVLLCNRAAAAPSMMTPGTATATVLLPPGSVTSMQPLQCSPTRYFMSFGSPGSGHLLASLDEMFQHQSQNPLGALSPLHHSSMASTPHASPQQAACTASPTRMSGPHVPFRSPLAPHRRALDGRAGAAASGHLQSHRPQVPGLNLRTIKKRSPLSNVRQSLEALVLRSARPISTRRGPGFVEASPTLMLRMLLPSACKPRGAAAAAYRLACHEEEEEDQPHSDADDDVHSSLAPSWRSHSAATAVPQDVSGRGTQDAPFDAWDAGHDAKDVLDQHGIGPRKQLGGSAQSSTPGSRRTTPAKAQLPFQVPPLPLRLEATSHGGGADSAPRKDTPQKAAAAAAKDTRSLVVPKLILPPPPLVAQAAAQPPAPVPATIAAGGLTARGARTRRMSICLPLSMLNGNGQGGAPAPEIEARGAGLQSHKLHTVFWMEELEDEEDTESQCQGPTDDAESDAGGIAAAHTETDDEAAHNLTLPEELWEVWARLSADPGRHFRMLDGLAGVQRITCTSYSTVSRALLDGQSVVVKIYDVGEADLLANAFAEIGVLLHLASWPGAVQLRQYGRNGDKVMLMLDHCDQSLKDWAEQQHDSEWGMDRVLDSLRVWHELAMLVDQLHREWCVAHCDLKPGNVLMRGSQLLLADFSESLLFHTAPLLDKEARGTAAYQPPEMVHSLVVDARGADVWALGCILYELVTGEMLFKGNSDCMRAVSERQANRRRTQRSGARADGRSTGSAGGASSGGGAAAVVPPLMLPLSFGGLAEYSSSSRYGSARPGSTGCTNSAVASARTTARGAADSARRVGMGGAGDTPMQQQSMSTRSCRDGVWAPAGSARRALTGADAVPQLQLLQPSLSVRGPRDCIWVPPSARSNVSATTQGTGMQQNGTARSIAASDWGPLPAGESFTGGGATSSGIQVQQQQLMRHSVGTQCSDPAAPTWMTFAETSRVRLWCDEQPVVTLASISRAGSSSSPTAAVGAHEPHDDSSSAEAERAVQGGRPGASGSSAAAGRQGGASPRSQRGVPHTHAQGPTIADDILQLLGAVLVSARQRPTAAQVAALAAEVIARHDGSAAAAAAEAAAVAAAAAPPAAPSVEQPLPASSRVMRLQLPVAAAADVAADCTFGAASSRGVGTPANLLFAACTPLMTTRLHAGSRLQR